MSPLSRRAKPAPAAVAAVSRIAHGAGLELRGARRDRRWTLRELADRAGVSVGTAHAAESGVPVSLETYARLAVALRLRPSMSFERPSAPERRSVNGVVHDIVHAAMGEVEARQFAGLGRQVAIDEPYQHYQFAGRADVLAWNLDARALLHLENKTRLVDLQDVAGSYNAKRAYLAAAVADRLGVGPAGWASVTHALVVLWSSDVLQVLRRHAASIAAICPSPLDSFSAWWGGELPLRGVTSSLVILDPAPSLDVRSARFVGIDRLATVRPRYRGYADTAAALRRGA